MSKGYRNGAFALGIVVGGGLALNLFLWLDYRTHYAKDAKTSAGQDEQYSEIGSHWDGMLGTFVSPSDTLAQWTMAVFTIAATVVLVFTLRSANNTNKAAIEASRAATQANDIMREEQRPWLSIEVSNLKIGAMGFDGMWYHLEATFDLAIVNTGSTAANSTNVYVVACEVGLIDQLDPFVVSMFQGKADISESIFAANGNQISVAPNATSRSRRFEMLSIRKRDREVFIFAVVEVLVTYKGVGIEGEARSFAQFSIHGDDGPMDRKNILWPIIAGQSKVVSASASMINARMT